MLYLFLSFSCFYSVFIHVSIFLSACFAVSLANLSQPQVWRTHWHTRARIYMRISVRFSLLLIRMRTMFWFESYGMDFSFFFFFLLLLCFLFCYIFVVDYFAEGKWKKKMKKYSISNNFVCIRNVILLNYIDVGSLEHKQWMKLAPFAYNLSKGKVCMSVTDRKFTWWCDWFWSTLNAEVLSLPMNKSSIYQRYYCSNLFFDSCTLAVKLDNIVTVQSVILLRLKPFLKKQICKLQIFTVMWKESL